MERNLFSLPAKFGGLGIFKPQERCSVEYANSSKIIAGMVVDVKEQNSMYNPDVQQAQKKITSAIKTEKQRRYSEELARFKDEITDPTRMRLLEATL